MNMIVEERSWAKAIEANPDFLIADGVYTNRYEAENAAKIIRKYVEDCLDVLTELLGW